MMNLVDNAIKYSPSDTAITCAVQASGRHVILSVCDQGEGIPPEMIATLFTPFDRAGRQDQNGAGLGLAFVQSVAIRHGAEIACTSIPGEGTCFRLKVPLEAIDHSQ